MLSSFPSRHGLAGSDTTILVKNVPYGTTIDQIPELFELHGDLSRVLVSPAGTAVEFERLDEVGKDSMRLLGSSTIYSEKGPFGIFDEHSIPYDSTKTSSTIRMREQSIVDITKLADTDQDLSTTWNHALSLKNLAFSTTQDRFVKYLFSSSSFSPARVQIRPFPKALTNVEAWRGLIRNFVLDGYALHLSFTDPTTSSTSSSKGRATKVEVKKCPFRSYEEGYSSFVKYINTYLLGRHLVLEWVEETE